MAKQQGVVVEPSLQDGKQETLEPNKDGNAAGQLGGQERAQAEERRFTQAELDKVIAERLAQEKARQEKALERARQEAEEKALAEQGKFRELYEQAQKRADEAEQARRELELATLRRQAADKAGLPVAFAERLRGETAEELEADAKALLAALPANPQKPAPPNINSGQGGHPENGKPAEAKREFEAWVRRI